MLTATKIKKKKLSLDKKIVGVSPILPSIRLVVTLHSIAEVIKKNDALFNLARKSLAKILKPIIKQKETLTPNRISKISPISLVLQKNIRSKRKSEKKNYIFL